MKKSLKERLCGYVMFPLLVAALIFVNMLIYFDRDPRFPPTLKEDLKMLWEDTFK